MNNEYMTVAQVAKTLNVSEQAVRDAIRRAIPSKRMQERRVTFLSENEVTLISEELHKGWRADKAAITNKEALLKFVEALDMLAKANGCKDNFADLRKYILTLTDSEAKHLTTTVTRAVVEKHTPELFRAAIAFADMFDRIHDTENHAIKAQRVLEDE